MIWTAVLIDIMSYWGLCLLPPVEIRLVVTNMRDYVSWGIYISNFVFFVAISLVGSLITAIFRLANVHWSYAAYQDSRDHCCICNCFCLYNYCSGYGAS